MQPLAAWKGRAPGVLPRGFPAGMRRVYHARSRVPLRLSDGIRGFQVAARSCKKSAGHRGWMDSEYFSATESPGPSRMALHAPPLSETLTF